MSSKQSSNRLINILLGKCPRCHSHKMFKANPYNVKRVFDMYKTCPHCGENLCPEPRYYEGSMYVSYGFSVAIVVSVFVAFNVLYTAPNINWMIAWAISIAVLFAPLNLRLSRTIWIHLFIYFKKEKEL